MLCKHFGRGYHGCGVYKHSGSWRSSFGMCKQIGRRHAYGEYDEYNDGYDGNDDYGDDHGEHYDGVDDDDGDYEYED